MTIPRSLSLLFIFIFSFLLFSYQINFQSLWLDEAATLDIVKSPPSSFWKKIEIDKHPPFYYLILKFLNLNTLVKIRYFSAFVSSLTITIIYLFWNDFLLTFLFLTSPFVFHFAQEGRMYSLNLFLSVIIIKLLEKYFFSNRNKEKKEYYFIGLIFFSLLGLYTHYYFFILSTVIVINFIWKKEIKDTFIFLLVLTIGYLPWMKFFWNDLKSGISWNPAYSIKLFPITIFKFTFGYAGKSFFLNLPFLGKAFLVYFLGFILIRGIWKLKKKGKKHLLFIPGNLILGLLISSIMAISLFKNSYLPKYLIIFFPFYLFILKEGISSFSSLKKHFILIIFLLIMFSIFMNYFSSPYLKGDWQRIFTFLEKKQIKTLYLYPAYLDLPFKVGGLENKFKIIPLNNWKPILSKFIKKLPHCAIIIENKYSLPQSFHNFNLSSHQFKRVKILF